MQDFGGGIPPGKLPHIFDRFHRGEEDSVIPGFGLGLSIAKSLIESLGGTIEMESEPEKGRVLTLDFPGVTFGCGRRSFCRGIL